MRLGCKEVIFVERLESENDHDMIFRYLNILRTRNIAISPNFFFIAV